MSSVIRGNDNFDTAVSKSRVKLRTANGYGSTSTVVRRFSTIDENVGSDITYVDSATLGSTFTINTAGVYSVSYTEQTNAASAIIVTKNSASLTGIPTSAETLAVSTVASANFSACAAWIGYLQAGDVIRPQTQSGLPAGTSTFANQFTIARIF